MSKTIGFLFAFSFFIIGSLYSQDYCEYEFKLPASDDGDLQGLGIKGGMDVHENYAFVGAFGDDTNGGQSGAAYVYERCGSEWIEIQQIIPADNESVDRYGRGVAVWENFAAVGAPYDDDKGNNSGSVYTYQLIDGLWEFDQKITANDGSASDWFGWTISIWEDYLLIGAQNDLGEVSFSGSAFVYKRIDDEWIFQTKLLAPDAASFDNFGLSLDIREGYAIVGADEKDGEFVDTGAAYIYKNVNDTWTFEAKLTASNGMFEDKFGYDVAISDSMAVVSSLNNDTLVIDAGAVYVFKNQGDGNWIEDDILISPETIISENFGITVDFNEQFLIAGTTTGFGLSEETGSTYLHVYDGTSWQYEQKIYSDDGQHADFFGTTSSMHESTIMLGALGDDSNGGNAGSVYMYHIDCSPVCTKLLTPSVSDTMIYSNDVLTWAEVVMADGYMLSIGSAPGLDDLFEIQDVGDTTSYSALLDGEGTAYVTIQPYNSFGITQACLADSFYMDILDIQCFLPENVVVSCDGELPSSEFSYVDTCSIVASIFEEDIISGDCPGNYTIIRTLVVTDECGVDSTAQVITIIDDVAPEVMAFTETVNVVCGESIPLLEPTVVDNCGDFTIEFSDSGSLTCGETISRTFSIIDECGNTTEVVQTIIIGEIIAPPACTTLMTPIGSEVSLDATLAWNAIISAEGYLVSAGTSPGGVDILDMIDVGNAVSYGPGDWPLAETIYVSIIPYNEFGEASDCQEYEFETIIVGLDEIETSASHLYIYPNPSFNQIVSISIPDFTRPILEKNLLIFDLSGRAVDFKIESNIESQSDTFSQAEIKISLSSGPGFYMVHLSQENILYTGQFCLMK